jgi:hypothetical protein
MVDGPAGLHLRGSSIDQIYNTQLHRVNAIAGLTSYETHAGSPLQGPDRPASISCSGSGKSRRLSIPKATRKVWIVTNV